MCHINEQYASDVSDAEWAIIAPYVAYQGWGRRMTLDARLVVNAIFYVLRSGCGWMYLPKSYPKWQSVYYHFRQWTQRMVWEAINDALCEQVRLDAQRAAKPSAAIIDSQSVKTTQAGGERGYDGGKKVNGRKRHIIVDTMGNLLHAVVHPAHIQDRDGAKLVLDSFPDAHLERLEVLWADSGYDGDLAVWMADTFTDWRLQLITRPPHSKGFLLLPRRWVVERTFAWLSRFRRLSRDYERSLLHSTAWLYLAAIRRLLRLCAQPALAH